MPAIYGPGCPTKYRPSGKRPKRGVSLRNQKAVAQKALVADLGTASFYYDAAHARTLGDVADLDCLVNSTSTQATPGKRPDARAHSWEGDDGPAVHFDGVGEAMPVPQILTGETGTAISAVLSTDAAIGARVIWEQTQQYNSANNGAIFGFASSGTPTSGIYSGAGGAAGGDFQVGTQEFDGVAVCFCSTFDRTSSGQDEILYANGVLETASQNADIAVSGNFGAGSGSWIGARNDGAARPLNGLIRILIIYDDWEMPAVTVRIASNCVMFLARMHA